MLTLNQLSPEEDFILGTLLGYDKSETQKWSLENRNKPRRGRELLVNI